MNNKITKEIRFILFSALVMISITSLAAIFPKVDKKQVTTIEGIPDKISLADPTIFYHDHVYYLYGTGGKNGFLVYTSSDMKTWVGPVGAKDGYALVKGDSYGISGFWAPHIFYRNGKFYMAYTADENIAIAESDGPLGPFKQSEIKPISGTSKQIDPYVFFDEDGKIYMYHVRLNNGNRLFVAEMNDDLSDIKPETLKECLSATEPWENTVLGSWPVAEGPTVLKLNNLYYLFYSANDFRNIDYAVGYAVASNPYGPWKKAKQNPIISRHTVNQNGPGHGDFLQDKNGDWLYVLHTHKSDEVVGPRATGIIKVNFVKDTSGVVNVVVDTNSFRFLFSQKIQ
jgi:beta-xylosidase